MLCNQLALIVCLLLLFGTGAVAAAAARKGDSRQIRVLHIFRCGLTLSACSYLLHICIPAPTGIVRVLSICCGFAGILMIWVGWSEHWSLLRDRMRVSAAAANEEQDDGHALDTVFTPESSLPSLNSCARRVLRNAEYEARCRRQCCADPDHLLLGLLREPDVAGSHILDRLGVTKDSIYRALGQPAAPGGDDDPTIGEPLPLTDRARQALALASQEAHRFDKASVGTDHLLLGLMLMGSSAAAVALFQEGVSVEAVRAKILTSRACDKHR